MEAALDACMKLCKDIRVQERQRILAVIQPHFFAAADIGLNGMIMAALENNMNGVVESYCKIVEHPNAKKTIVNIMKDISKLIKSMDKEVIEAAECYLTKCDKKSVQLIISLMRAYISTSRMATDKTVQKAVWDIHEAVLQRCHTSSQKLQAGLKSMPSSPPKTKSAPITKSAQKTKSPKRSKSSK